MPSWLNEFYTDDVLREVREQFKEDKNFNLLLFLSEEGKAQFENLDWTKQYDPLTHSYSTAPPPSFAGSEEFKALLEKITGAKLSISALECRKFEHGDYTLLHDESEPKTGLVITLELTSGNEEHGGYTSYIDDNQEVVRQVPIENALFVIDQKGLVSFTKYLNHYAKPRIFLYAEIEQE